MKKKKSGRSSRSPSAVSNSASRSASRSVVGAGAGGDGIDGMDDSAYYVEKKF